MFLAALVLLALTRAEIIQRMRAPVVTRADGLVKVYANCDEDVRRTYQFPVASFVDDALRTLRDGLSIKSIRHEKPRIIVLLGADRTNTTEVVTSVSTNDGAVVSRIYLRNPATSNQELLRTELARAFARSILEKEISADEAMKLIRRTDPKLRIADERAALEDWLQGKLEKDFYGSIGEEALFAEFDKNITRMRKVLEPGVASKRDVLTFASRLHLYPRTFDEKFIGGADVLSFADAIEVAKKDPRVRFLALFKMNEVIVFAGGRGEYLAHAAEAYNEFLFALAKGGRNDEDLRKLLKIADMKLKAAEAQAL